MDIAIPAAAAPRAAASSPAPPASHRADARSFDRVLSSSVEDEQPRTAGSADRPEASAHREAQPAPAARDTRPGAKRPGGNPKAAAPHLPTRSGASRTPSTAASNRPGAASRPEAENEPKEPVAGGEAGQWLMMANPTESTPASVDVPASGGLPALLLISLTTPVAAPGAAGQADATTGEQADAPVLAGASGSATGPAPGGADAPGAAGAAVLPAGIATAVGASANPSEAGVPPALDSSEAASEAETTATMLADDVAAASSGQSTEVGESDAAEKGARPGQAAATTLDAARSARHPARQLAQQILAQAIAAARPDGSSSQHAPGEGPASAGTTADGTSAAPAAAIEPVRPGRLSNDPRLRAGSENADNAPAAVAPFLVSAEDAGQDQRGGASRGGHAWSSAWPQALETPRTTAKPGSGVSASAPFSIAAPIQPAASFVTPLAAAVNAGESSTLGAQAPLADAEVARQVVRAVSLAWHDQVGEARLHLTPEHLGEVTVSLRVERGIVSAVLQADTAAARDWIRAHESDLRQGLEGQGLHLDSMVVTEDGTSQGRQDQQAPPRRQRPVPANRAADAPRFEIRV